MDTWRFKGVVVAAIGFVLVMMTCVAAAGPRAEDFFPVKTDPFVGNWEGRWSVGELVDPTLAAQVIALGNGKYRIRLVAKLDMRSPPKLVFEVNRSGERLRFQSGAYYGEIEGEVFRGGRNRGKGLFELHKITRVSPSMGAKPPEGAVVLFDGSGFGHWQKPEGWVALDGGILMVTPKGKDIVSKGVFGDLEMHVEFRTPFMPRARGQQRGNSGVFINDVYEIQILDSFGLEGYYDECGALYKLSAPHANACSPPLEWQTFDIAYQAPRFSGSGKLEAKGRMTVHHNGVLIHNDQELKWITAWTEEERKAEPPRGPGHIKLQAHANFMQYRNLWLVEK